MSDPKRKLVESFRAWLLGRGYSPTTVDAYSVHVANGADDMILYLRNLRSWQRFKHAQESFRHLAAFCGRQDAIPTIMAVAAPRKPPKRPIRLPSLGVWRALGPWALRTYPGPLAHVLWIVFYSGLRIGDILTITRPQAEEALRTGETLIRQKGLRGERQRRWRPMSFVIPALQHLVREPGWATLYSAIGPSIKASMSAVRDAIPNPWHPHLFRHAVASYLHAAGVTDRTIMEIGGWESMQSLARYMDFVPAPMMKDADQRLARLIFGEQKDGDPAPQSPPGRLAPPRRLSPEACRRPGPPAPRPPASGSGPGRGPRRRGGGGPGGPPAAPAA